MQVKVIPIGQILMLALLIFLTGIGITVILKKMDANSKLRRIILHWSTGIALVIVLLGVLGIYVLFDHKMPYTWSLYPQQIETTLTAIQCLSTRMVAMLGLFLLSFGIVAPILWIFTKLLDKINKFCDWYNNLIK